MQATATTRRLQNRWVWLALALVVLLGVLAAGAALTMTTDDGIPATISARPVVEPKAYDNIRFAEMNALPEVLSAPIETYVQIRLREINMLPGDDASHAAPSSVNGSRRQ